MSDLTQRDLTQRDLAILRFAELHDEIVVGDPCSDDNGAFAVQRRDLIRLSHSGHLRLLPESALQAEAWALTDNGYYALLSRYDEVV